MKNEIMTYDQFRRLAKAGDSSEMVRRLRSMGALNFEVVKKEGGQIYITFKLSHIERFIQSQGTETIKQHEKTIKKLSLDNKTLAHENKELKLHLQFLEKGKSTGVRSRIKLKEDSGQKNNHKEYNETKSDPPIWSKDYTYRKF